MKYDVYQGLFIWPQKKTLNLHLTYFVETLYSASPQTNKKALIPLGIRAFPNFAFLRSGAYGTRTRDPMRDSILPFHERLPLYKSSRASYRA